MVDGEMPRRERWEGDLPIRFLIWVVRAGRPRNLTPQVVRWVHADLQKLGKKKNHQKKYTKNMI